MPSYDEVLISDNPNDAKPFDINNLPQPIRTEEEKERAFQERLKEITARMEEDGDKPTPVDVNTLAAMSASLLEAAGKQQHRQQEQASQDGPRREKNLEDLLPSILDAIAGLCCHKADKHTAAVTIGIDEKEKRIELVVADNDTSEPIKIQRGTPEAALLGQIGKVDPEKTVKFLEKMWFILRRISNRNARLLLKEFEAVEKRRSEEDSEDEGREKEKAAIVSLKEDTEAEKKVGNATKEDEEDTDIFGLGLELAECATRHLHEILRFKVNRRQERFFEFTRGFREKVLPKMDEEEKEDFGEIFDHLLTDMSILNGQINYETNKVNWPKVTAILLQLHTAYDDESDLAALLDEPGLIEKWAAIAAPEGKKPFKIRFFINELIVFPHYADRLFRASIHPKTRHLFAYKLQARRLKPETRGVFLPTSQTGWKKRLEDLGHEQGIEMELDEQISLKLWIDYASMEGAHSVLVHNECRILTEHVDEGREKIKPFHYIGTSATTCSFCRLVFKAYKEIEKNKSFTFREGPTKLEYPWVLPLVWPHPKDRGDQEEMEGIVKRELAGRFVQRLLVSGKAKRKKDEQELEEPADPTESYEV